MSKARVSLVAILGFLLATCAPGTGLDGQPGNPSAQPSTASAEPSAPGRPDTWVAAGMLNDHRVGTQLARLGSGDVLALGDDLLCGIENQETDTVELWGPAPGAWRMAAPLPTQRNGILVVPTAAGDALVTGGANSDYVAKSSTVVFDDQARDWLESGLLNTARMAFAAAPMPDGRVLVAGGLHIGFSQEGRALNSAELWDPDTGTWTRIDEMSSARVQPAAATLSDGRVLVAGGVEDWGGDDPLVSAETYDPVDDRWSAAGALSAPRDGLAIIPLADGGALAVGARRPTTEDPAAGSPTSTMAADRFDPSTGRWVAAGEFEAGGRRPALTLLADGRVLAIAGTKTAIYDPAARTWTGSVAIPDHRNDATAVLLEDGSVLVAGGWRQWLPDTPGCPTPLPETWRFVPATTAP